MKRNPKKVNQSEAFREKAKELGCDDKEEHFDAMLRSLVPPVEAKEPEPREKKKGRE